MIFSISNSKWFWVFGALLLITSCTDRQKVVNVAEDEILLIINKSNSYIVIEGEQSINEDSKTISFNKTDSLIINEFDILDTNAQTLYCRSTVSYKLTSRHIRNILKKLEWIHTIKSYKKRLIEPEIRSYIRDLGLQTQDEILISDDFVAKSNIENTIANRLKKFIQLESIKVKIYKK